jgi:multicomponent Na+:H+ antiporter subunit B
LLFGAPDVAMAEAVVSTLSTVIFIVSFEKYYSLSDSAMGKKAVGMLKHILAVIFSVFLFALFIWFIPGDEANPFLKDQYITMFSHDVGGENAVTAIYLGYRMYDTLFEALMLLISIVAVIHLSFLQEALVLSGKRKDVNRSDITFFLIRIICPILLLFGVYLIMNGHNSPGGGFQGGVVLASFFICRYVIHAIHDIRINSVIMLEKVIYVGIVLLAGFFVFLNAQSYLPLPKSVYLVMMNLFIGMKVACGFLIIFYRFIAFEWR